MKQIIPYCINVLLVIFLWIFSASFSQDLAKFVVVLSFIFLLIKNLFKYVFLMYYWVLFLSDSRLELLSFMAEIKSIIAILFYFICGMYFIKRDKSKLDFNYKYLIPFLICISFSLLISGSNFLVLQKSFSYVFLFIFLMPVFQDFHLKENKFFLKVFIYNFILILILGMVFYYINRDITILSNRFRGLFGNPNGLGISILLFFFIFQLINSKFENLFSKKESIIIVFILLLNLVFCQSRSCILSILIFYVFNFLFNYSSTLALLSSLIILVSYGFISINLLEFLSVLGLQDYIRLDTLENASGRYIAWDFIWQKINNNTFFLGNGLGSTELLFKENYSHLSQLGHQGNAHNSFLTIWYDTGFLGLLSFLYFIFMSFINSNNFLFSLPILLGLLLSAFYESWMSASLNPFTILFVFIIVLVSHRDNFQLHNEHSS